MVKVGDKAPDFSLPDKNSETHTLSEISSDFTVVYFYPKDNTPGCTVEAIEFTEAIKEYEKANTTIIGISGGDEKSKTKFVEKNKLGILLLTDADFKVATAYESYGQKKFMGREYMGIIRNTFVLDKDKKVIKVFEKVTPKGHAKEVLDIIQKS